METWAKEFLNILTDPTDARIELVKQKMQLIKQHKSAELDFVPSQHKSAELVEMEKELALIKQKMESLAEERNPEMDKSYIQSWKRLSRFRRIAYQYELLPWLKQKSDQSRNPVKHKTIKEI
jgi:hypothetical protein